MARKSEPAASVPSTATSARFSAVAASAPAAVIAARVKNHIAIAPFTFSPAGTSGILPHCTSSSWIPNAIQNAPHAPCIAVATASRARYAHIPASSCATPPNASANGHSSPVDFEFPYQPARCAATANVAAAKPYRPRIDGAATGCNTTRGRANPSSHSVPFSTVTTRRASVALISCLLSLLLRNDRVTRIPRRLETGAEDRPPQGELAGEDERAAGDRRAAAAPPAGGEQRCARCGEHLRSPPELAGGSLLVDLADEAETVLHRLHHAELGRDAGNCEPARRARLRRRQEQRGRGARARGGARPEQ